MYVYVIKVAAILKLPEEFSKVKISGQNLVYWCKTETYMCNKAMLILFFSVTFVTN
jgi:hypothetical protein